MAASALLLARPLRVRACRLQPPPPPPAAPPPRRRAPPASAASARPPPPAQGAALAALLARRLSAASRSDTALSEPRWSRRSARSRRPRWPPFGTEAAAARRPGPRAPRRRRRAPAPSGTSSQQPSPPRDELILRLRVGAAQCRLEPSSPAAPRASCAPAACSRRWRMLAAGGARPSTSSAVHISASLQSTLDDERRSERERSCCHRKTPPRRLTRRGSIARESRQLLAVEAEPLRARGKDGSGPRCCCCVGGGLGSPRAARSRSSVVRHLHDDAVGLLRRLAAGVDDRVKQRCRAPFGAGTMSAPARAGGGSATGRARLLRPRLRRRRRRVSVKPFSPLPPPGHTLCSRSHPRTRLLSHHPGAPVQRTPPRPARAAAAGAAATPRQSSCAPLGSPSSRATAPRLMSQMILSAPPPAPRRRRRRRRRRRGRSLTRRRCARGVTRAAGGEALEEDGRARRDAHLDPAVDEDAVLRVQDLRLGAEEEEVERGRTAVVDVDLAGGDLLVVDEPGRCRSAPRRG